jgi:ATP-dependent Lon protease
LDPEQTHGIFPNHDCCVDYDLSQVMFIATANTTQSDSAGPQDRMESSACPEHTEDEKLAMPAIPAPKQLAANGLKEKDLTLPGSRALLIIRPTPGRRVRT